MTNEENTKEVIADETVDKMEEGIVEALAEALAEGLIEEEKKESEEVSEQESDNELAGKEPKEIPVEEEPVMENPQKEQQRKPRKKAIAIGVAVAAVIMLVIYFAMSMHYSERLFAKTVVNGTDCSGKTIEEVKEILQKQVEEYVLTIIEANGASEHIKGTDINITYIGYHQIEEAFDEQNPYLWPKSLFIGKEIKAEIDFEYDSQKLDELIAGLECLKAEKQVAPVSATVIYQNGQFEIQNEVPGTQIITEKLSEVIHASVAAMDKSVSLEETGCYVQPQFTKESAEVIAAKDEMNKYLTSKITYSLDSIEVTVDKEMIAQWVSVDENMTPVISSDLVKTFTDTLGSKYNTANQSGVMVTPKGKEVSMANAVLGRRVGSQAECEQLISEIKEGKTVKRAPILSQTATPEGQYVWGTTYVEVDITEQHMWFIQNGAVVFECDVVTGSPGRDTPAGIFKVLEKLEDKVLRGEIVPSTGKPEYLTPVDYWVRITWTGIGFHDATWQAEFGGQRYLQGYGSHGCINMPLDAVKEFYGLIYVGCPAVVHY